MESLPEVSKVEEVVLSGDISLAPSNTYNLSMSTKWQIDNNKPISVIVPSDADMTVFKQKYPNLLSASPYRYLNVSVG